MKGVNVVDLHPMPPILALDRKTWIATPEVVRNDIVRCWREQLQGIAVQKDKCCGRKRSHRAMPGADSFFELHKLDMALWLRPDNEDLQEKAAAMRERLAPDFARLQILDDLEPFHALAAERGKTLAAVLGEYTEVERRLRVDPVRELERMANSLGVDFADVLAQALDLPEEAA
jgi:hypothetical protein